MNENSYLSPQSEVIEICAESVICVSGAEMSVGNPWEGNEEKPW